MRDFENHAFSLKFLILGNHAFSPEFRPRNYGKNKEYNIGYNGKFGGAVPKQKNFIKFIEICHVKLQNLNHFKIFTKVFAPIWSKILE